MRRLASTLLLATMLSGFSTPVSAHAPTPDKVVETVRLGHDPVKVRQATRVRLKFSGEKGELVNLARWSVSDVFSYTPRGKRTLRLDGKVVTPFADGYWRLPADGSYAVTWRPPSDAPPYGKVALQMRKVVRKDVAVGGPTVTFSTRTNRTYVARVRLAGERIRLRSTGDIDHVTRGPELTLEPIGGRDLFLEPGGTLHTDDDRSWGYAVRARTGTYLVTVAAGSTVQLSTAQSTPIALDGPATGPHSDADHEQLFTFQGIAGQVVQNASDDPFPWDEVLTGPDGSLVPGLSYAPGWELPASGTYTLSARAFLDEHTAKDFAVRLRTATTGPAMTAGEAAHFVPTEPGRWVASRVQVPTTLNWFFVGSGGAAGDPTWQAFASGGQASCPYESTANGACESIGGVVNAERASTYLSQADGRTFVVIYDPGAAGALAPVDLAIKSAY